MSDIVVRPFVAADAPVIAAAFTALGWHKPLSQYEAYLRQQDAGTRAVLVATMGGTFAGYLTVVWAPEYEPFRDAGIPEAQDLNVLPDFRRVRVASKLMDEAERLIGERSAVAGIGVGMDPSYGNAQRMYVRRGYIPDGLGLTTNHRHVQWGETVTVDDDLVLYFTRRLRD